MSAKVGLSCVSDIEQDLNMSEKSFMTAYQENGLSTSEKRDINKKDINSENDMTSRFTIFLKSNYLHIIASAINIGIAYAMISKRNKKF